MAYKNNSVKLQNDADIVPNTSLGGLTVRTRLLDIQELIMDRLLSHKVSFEIDPYTPFSAVYSFHDIAIDVAVDVRNGKIYKISAIEGYTGTLFGKIRVGMPVSEAMQLEPRLYYHEGEELILCREVDGLSIDVPEIDPPTELVPTMNIHAISVYAEEVHTLQGNRGEW